MLIEKNGMKFEIVLKGSEINVFCNQMKGYGIASISMLQEKTAFSYSSLKNVKGIVNGFMFTAEQVEEIKNEYNNQAEEIKNFLNNNKFEIKCLQYKHFYVVENEKVIELKKINEQLFNTLASQFIQVNRKNLVEIDRTVEAYSEDVIFYVIKEEVTKEALEIVRELTEEEAKQYTVNEEVEGLIVVAKSELKNDIDYGKMYVNKKYFAKKNNKIIEKVKL